MNLPPGGYRRPPAKDPGKGKGRNTRRRRQIYKLLFDKHGFVPCYVCRLHVEWEEATLEHIIPKARGGTKTKKNLSISHQPCNVRRGAPEIEHVQRQ